MKNNFIPKGLDPLDKLFDNNDATKNPKVAPNGNEVEDYNIGTKQEPNMIKLSKYLTHENIDKYIDLMKTFFMFLHGFMNI